MLFLSNTILPHSVNFSLCPVICSAKIKWRRVAASIVVRDDATYLPYSRGNPYIDPYYNSTGFYDEHMWRVAWLYYATGNSSYISFATNPGIPKNSKAFYMIPELRALSWDNKLIEGGMIELNLAGVPGWSCGPMYISYTLRQFSTSKAEYILGNNPANMSHVVGYVNKYPKYVHHRAASTMVAGPDKFDQFKDVRQNDSYTEPSMAGNAGLVAVLISLTTSGGVGVDKNTIFSEVPPLYPDGSSSEY